LRGVSSRAFVFTAPNDSLPCKSARALRYDRALIFLAVAFEVDDDPIPCHPEIVRSRGVGEEGGERPSPTFAVKNWKPRAVLGVEAARGDPMEFVSLSAKSILCIDGEDFRYGRNRICACGGARGRGIATALEPSTRTRVPPRRSVENARQRVLNPAGPPGPNARHVLEPPVVGRNFEFLESLDTQFEVDVLCEPLADARNRHEEILGRYLPFEPVEQRDPAAVDVLVDERGDAPADPGQPHEALSALFPGDLGERANGGTYVTDSGSVRADPVNIRALRLEEIPDSFEPIRHVLVVKPRAHALSLLVCDRYLAFSVHSRHEIDRIKVFALAAYNSSIWFRRRRKARIQIHEVLLAFAPCATAPVLRASVSKIPNLALQGTERVEEGAARVWTTARRDKLPPARVANNVDLITAVTVMFR